MKPTLRIVHNLARSGGTIMARCLGCMDGVALLSEIHPTQRQVFSPTKQAREWYGLDVPYIEDFVEAIRVVEHQLRERGRALMIRTWNHIDFMPSPWNNWRPPRRSMLCQILGDHFELRRVAIVRDPEPMWQSLERFLSPPERFPRAEFAAGYREYQDMATPFGKVHYEDFLADPARAMRSLCDALELPFDPGFVDKWRSYFNVTGDLASFGRTNIGPRETER